MLSEMGGRRTMQRPFMGERHALPQHPAWRRAEVHIFDEVPEALALVLWQGLRHVRVWWQTPAPRRAELFHAHPRLSAESRLRDARAADPELRAPLDGLLAVTRSPLAAADRDVAAACAEIARWAERHGHVQTAILFAEAAAVLDGSDPALANHAGRLTRNAGEFARADLWFQRAIGLARSADASVEYTRAQLGYGRLWHTLGDVERARKHYNRGSVAAMRQGLEWLAAEAQHDIFALMFESGMFDQAELYARRALRFYPKQHERLPVFAADFGYLLVATRHHRAAVPLLREAVRKASGGGARLVVAALYARALAGNGQLRTMRPIRRRLLDAARHSEVLPAVLVHVAEGARFTEEWDLALTDAATALDIAGHFGDTGLQRLARDLIQAVAQRPSTPAEAAPLDPVTAEFLVQITERLRGWTAARVRRSRSAVRNDWVA
jgi:tetratricopeptide (TPR) repeat protein